MVYKSNKKNGVKSFAHSEKSRKVYLFFSTLSVSLPTQFIKL